ncbi:MAG: deoxyribose-phosphate aldolase, partial [Lachnospiraceae bacterium]|nr:deoxyribose-phosphate aldolase [Lachnospiraceae bacterium]
MPESKAFSAKLMVDSGVDTFDCSMNYRALYSGHPEIVEQEMKLVREACKDIECKFIIEVAFLTDEQIVQACRMCMDAGIDWVKTSSGQFQGPNMDQVKIILDTLKGSNTRCKVSGVKYPRPQNAFSFLTAGVEIIGTQGVTEIIESFDMFREMGILPEYAG